MHGFGIDLRDATRRLSRTPGFAATAVLTLALAVGANSALFSVVNAVLLRPLPFDGADELYAISSVHGGVRRPFASLADFVDWRTQSRTFSNVAAVRGASSSLTTPAGPEYLTGVAVSPDFFPLFHVQPFLGRTFAAGEYDAPQARVVLLSHTLWRRRFGGSPSAVGATVILDAEPHVVVGVLPEHFAFPDDAQFWRPLTLPATRTGRRVEIVRVVGRRRADVTEAEARGELIAIAGRLAADYPENAGWSVDVVPLQQQSTETVRRTLMALWGAVGCVLLVACANVGILLLARGIRRLPEMALRSALGAGHARIVRQLVIESLVLGGLGGAGGLFLSYWGIAGLRSFAPPRTPRLEDASLDTSVVLFTVGVALATGLLASGIPAWRLHRTDLERVLREGDSRASPSRRQHRLMRALGAAQVAVTLMLLVGAGLMVATLARLHAVPLGLDAERLLTGYVSLPDARYRDAAQVRAFYHELIDRVRALPGVRAASAVSALYVQWSRAIVVPVSVEGRPAPDSAAPADTHVRIVDPDVHRVLQTPLRRGRTFASSDSADGHAVVINETMARRYFPGEDPVGRRISVLSDGPDRPIWWEIVGVVADVRQFGLDAAPAPEVQVTYDQSPVNTMALLVRSEIEPGALATSLAATVRTLDPDLPLTFVQTMDDVVESSLAGRTFGMRVLSLFAAVALALTALGLYAGMAAAVGDRTREVAVRLALGAGGSRVVAMVVSESLTAASAGLLVGLVGAVGTSRYLAPLVFGLPPTDLATYGATATLIFIVASLSAYLPARRLARVDPATVLRAE